MKNAPEFGFPESVSVFGARPREGPQIVVTASCRSLQRYPQLFPLLSNIKILRNLTP